VKISSQTRRLLPDVHSSVLELDGSDEPMPILEASVEWAEIEEWVHLEVRCLARERVGLPQTGGV